jgi:pimeloyl-ACP methyl ester carboxylesterase
VKEEFITINGCRIFLQRGGKGPPLLWLHGAGGGGRWTPALQRLAQRFDVIAPEYPGFGRSDTPEWFDNIHDVAYCVLDLLRALQLRGVHMVGASLGGWVAAEAAVRSTERLASLTLIGPAGLHMKGVPRPDTFLWTEEEATRALFHDQRLADAMLAAEPDEDEQDRRLKNRFATARLAWAPRWFDPHLEKWLHRRPWSPGAPRTATCRRSTPRIGAAASPAARCMSSPIAAIRRSPRRPRRSAPCLRISPRGSADEVLLLPPDALCAARSRLRQDPQILLGHPAERLLRSGARRRALQPLPG